MQVRLQQRLLSHSFRNSPKPASFHAPNKALDLFFMGRDTHHTRRLLSLQWSVLGPFPRSVHVVVQQPVSVEATVTHHALLQASKYSLAPRGNGGTSFRICEAIGAESVPIYIWNSTVAEGAVLPLLDRPFSDFSLVISSNHLPLLPPVLDCISDESFGHLVAAGRSVARDFTVAGVINRVFSALDGRAVPRKFLDQTNGLFDIMRRALENAAQRRRDAPLCRQQHIRNVVSTAYVLRVLILQEEDLDVDCHFSNVGHSGGGGAMQCALRNLLDEFRSNYHAASVPNSDADMFSTNDGGANAAASYCDMLIALIRPLLQCSIPTAELLARASFVLRTCHAPLSAWAPLVNVARKLCAPASQRVELEDAGGGDAGGDLGCSGSTAMRVNTENLALKFEMSKQQTTPPRPPRRTGTRHGTFARQNVFPLKYPKRLRDSFPVHIMGMPASAPLLQAYRGRLRAIGIVHADAPTSRGSCLIIATKAATVVHSAFVALGARLCVVCCGVVRRLL